MKPIGEQQLQRMYSEYLGAEVRKKFGPRAAFACGDFNAMQDRKFADYFASVASVNILVEFKEFEVASERRKPLRGRLCADIQGEALGSSLRSHFISWREEHPTEVHLRFDSYLPKVCPLFGQWDVPSPTGIMTHSKFTNQFLDASLGLELRLFRDYVRYLGRIGGAGGGEEVRFAGLLISYDETGAVRATIFESLSQLIQMVRSISLDIDPPDIGLGAPLPPIRPRPRDDGPSISM